MARTTEEEKKQAQDDFEVRNMGIREIARKYAVSPTTVRNWRDAGDWEQGKTAHIINKKKNAFKELHETAQQTAHLPAHQQVAIDTEVQKQLEDEQIFINAAKFNQMKANSIMKSKSDLTMGEVEAHSRLTNRNKETVLGKAPDTAVQINNSVGVETKPIAEIFEQ